MAKKSKLIQVIDLSADAGPWDIIDLGEYSEIYICSFDQESTINDEVLVQFSSNNGASFINTNYRTVAIADGFNTSDNVDTGAFLAAFANKANNFWGSIKNFNVAAPTFMSAAMNQSGGNRTYVMGTMQDSAVVMNAIRILKTTQDFTTGLVYVWGAREVLDLLEARDCSIAPGTQEFNVSGYKKINVVANIGTNANDTRIRAQFSTDGGNTWITTGYRNSWVNGNGSGLDLVENISSFEIKDGISDISHQCVGAFENVDVTIPMRCSVMFNLTSIERFGAGLLPKTSAVDRMRILSPAATINSGTIWVTGVA